MLYFSKKSALFCCFLRKIGVRPLPGGPTDEKVTINCTSNSAKGIGVRLVGGWGLFVGEEDLVCKYYVR